jgi:hypothetical protein
MMRLLDLSLGIDPVSWPDCGGATTLYVERFGTGIHLEKDCK